MVSSSRLLAAPKYAAKSKYEAEIIGIQRLLETKIDINVFCEDGEALLLWAAKRNNHEAMKLLIRAKANVNIADKNGDTPLLLAIRHNNMGAILSLIEAKVCINPSHSDYAREMPLLLAIWCYNFEAVKHLVEARADVNQVDPRHNQTPLTAATIGDQIAIVRYLMEAKAKVNVGAPERGKAPLLWAATNHNPEIIEVLLRANANVNAVDKKGDTALIILARNNKINITQRFVNAYGYSLYRGIGKNNPYETRHLRRLDAIKLLIDAKADVNAADKKGNTPLSWSIMHNDTDAMALFIGAGADINKVINEDGDTLLHVAFQEKSLEAIQLLLHHGATQRSNHKGETLLTLAAKIDNETIANKIREMVREDHIKRLTILYHGLFGQPDKNHVLRQLASDPLFVHQAKPEDPRNPLLGEIAEFLCGPRPKKGPAVPV